MAADPKSAGWTLDPQIERDTVSVGDLPLCRVLLMNDANYPWLLLVPRRPDAGEIATSTCVEQTQLMAEIAATAQSLKAITTLRQNQRRCAGQCGGAAPRSCHRALSRRRGLAEAGVGRGAAARPSARRGGKADHRAAPAAGACRRGLTGFAWPLQCPPPMSLPFDLGPRPHLGYTQSLIDRVAERRLEPRLARRSHDRRATRAPM